MLIRCSLALLAVAFVASIVLAQTPTAPVHSVRAAHPVAAMIDVEQPNFPAEITHNNHNDSDWLQMVRVTSRTAMEIVSVHVGWAYALPGGLEFHESETITPTNRFRIPVRIKRPFAGIFWNQMRGGRGPHCASRPVL